MASHRRCGVVGLAAVLLWAGVAGAEEEKPTAATASGRTLVVTVVDQASSQPLGGAEVSYRVGDAKTKKLVADEKGVVSVPLAAKEPQYLNITAKAPKHVPTALTFRNDPEHPKQPVPGAYTLKLEAGTVIGGVVQDPEGKPVEGATVYLLVPANTPGNVRAAIWDFPVKTDAEGRWRTDVMPADLPDIWIRLKHPDYASDTMYGQTPKPSMEKLRDQTGVMVMRRGIAVAGRVTDEGGKPIAGATVAQGRDRWGSNYPSTKTDAEGRYAFKNTPAGELVLTVQAKGYAPDLKSTTVRADEPAVDFKLGAGKQLKGHVVDPEGKPVARATVVADTWRGNRSIHWETKTGADGAFAWDSAPADAVKYNAYAEGYAYNREATLTAADGADLKVTLTRPLPVRVTVTDAETHQPVTRYRLLEGISWGDGRAPYWERREQGSLDHPGGTADVRIDEPRPGHAVRIEADGYAPAESRVFKDSEGSVTLAFELRKAANLSATVLTPDGKPAVGADVGLAVLPYGVQVQNGRIAEQSDRPVTRTDGAGRFSFPPQNGKYKVVVTHDAGMAVLTPEQVAAGKPITLEAWAHVEGTMKIGAKPAAGEVVYGWYGGRAAQCRPDEPNVMLMVQSTTDASGRFRLDRVPAGEVHLGRQVKLSDRMTGYSHNVPVTLKPGEAATVAIGGTGRPVTGRAEIPAEILARGNWTPSNAGLATDVKYPKPNVPEEVKTMSPEERQKWYAKWMTSPEGKAFEAEQAKASAAMRSYPVPINPDGTFRVEDVPAGAYKLSVTIADAPAGNTCGWGDELAAGSVDVTVPEMAGGRSDEPLEVPTLALTPVKHLNVGDRAPDFAVKSLEGKEIRLADYKGKYVLLDFWATWCGPCVAELPNVKAVNAAHGGDPRFVIVSLSLDDEPATALAFVRKNGMTWPQGSLGEWAKATLTNTYGVRGIPATFLVGPDGKIVAKDLRGEALKTEVNKVLGGAAK